VDYLFDLFFFYTRLVFFFCLFCLDGTYFVEIYFCICQPLVLEVDSNTIMLTSFASFFYFFNLYLKCVCFYNVLPKGTLSSFWFSPKPSCQG